MIAPELRIPFRKREVLAPDRMSSMRDLLPQCLQQLRSDILDSCCEAIGAKVVEIEWPKQFHGDVRS